MAMGAWTVVLLGIALDCAELSDAPRCGMHSAPDDVCTSHPDDR